MSRRLSAVASLGLRRMRTLPAGILANWDRPAEADLRVSDPNVEIAGWALAGRGLLGRSIQGAPIIEVYADGVLVGSVTASQPRPDVRRAYGRRASGGGWSMVVPLDPDANLSMLEVVVVVGCDGDDGGRTRRSLGTRRVHLNARPQDPVGRLEQPADGEVVDGVVVQVRGWAAFPNAEVDTVEVWMDDRAPLRARRGESRPDVRTGIPWTGLNGLTAGYGEIVPMPAGLPGDKHTVQVRVRAVDGRVWQSPSTTFELGRPVADESVRVDETIAPWMTRVDPPPRSSNAERLRVCVFTHSLLLGGGELYLQELLLRLQQRGELDILVVTPSDGALREDLEKAGISVHLTAPYNVSPSAYGGRLTELVAIMQAWRADVVLANTLGVFQAVDAANQARIPAVWAVHESFDLRVFAFLNWGQYGLHPAIDARLRHALENAEVVFEAQATLDTYRESVPALRGRRIAYGVQLDAIAEYVESHDQEAVRRQLGFAPEDRVVLCMGVFQERKAQLALVAAFSRLCRAFPHAKLVLVGDHATRYSAAIHQYVSDAGVGSSIRIEKIVPDIYRWYRAADVMISASDIESLPRSVLEAMAFGLPTMAADVFGLSEVITDGVNGWLFEARNGAALTGGLRRVLELSAAELAEVSAQCRRDSAAHDGQGYADEYLELFRELGRVS